MEAIKIITGVGELLRGRWLTFDALAQRFQTLELARNPNCPLCGHSPTIRGLHPQEDAPETCEPPPATTLAPEDFPLEISVVESKERREAQPDRTLIIDVREPYELEICRIDGARHIPMRQIPDCVSGLDRDKYLLILCHSGARSRRVTEFLRSRGFVAVSNITGGIDAWAEQIDPGMRRY
jgi:adenylyltransferase/sulfurtransferase